MFDSVLAVLYEIETMFLNLAVRRKLKTISWRSYVSAYHREV